MAIKKKKLFIQIFCAVLSVWILFLALVPTLLSKGGLKYFANRKLPGAFSYEKAHLSWFGSQSLRAVEYTNPSQGIELKIDSLTAQASLWDLLLHPRDLKETQVQGLEGSLFFSKEGASPLLSAMQTTGSFSAQENSHTPDKPPFLILSLPFVGKLHVDESEFIFASSDYDPISLNKIQLNCNMISKSGPLMCNLACETSQKELSGTAFLNFELGGFDPESKLILTPFDRDIFFLSPKGYLQLNAQLTNLPSEGFDHLAHLYNPKLEGVLSPLFGDSLNLGSQINVIKGKSNLNLMADAPNVDLKFSGSIVQNEFFLDEASICNLKITPAFVQAISQSYNLENPLSISKTAEASIQLDRLSIPLDFKNFNLNTLSCNAQISLGEIDFKNDALFNDLKIQQITAVVDTFDMGENVTFHFKGVAEDQSNPLLVKLDGQISKLLNLQESKGMEQLQGHCQLEFKDVPSRFITSFTKNKDLLNEILGPSTSLNLKFKGSPAKGALSLYLNSSRLHLAEALFDLKDKEHLTLNKTSFLEYRLNPSLAKLILNPKIACLHPFEVQGKMKKLDLVLDSTKIGVADIDMKFSLKSFETSFENSKPIHIEDAKVYLSKNDQSKVEAKAYFTAILPEGYERKPIGNSFSFSMLFKEVPLFSESKTTELAGLIKGRKFSTEFEAFLDSDFNLHLTQKLKATLQPFSYNYESFKFNFSSPLNIEIDPCTLSLSDLETNNLNLKGTIFSPALECNQGKNHYSLSNLSLPFKYLGKDSYLDFELSSESKKINLRGMLTQIDITNPSTFDFHVQGKAKEIPAKALNCLTQNSLDLKALIGPLFDCNIDAKGSKKQQLQATISYLFSSDALKSSGHFTVDKELFLNDPLTANYTLTPQACAALLSKDSKMNLIEPAHFKIILSRLHKQMSPLNQLPLAFEGEIHASEIITQEGELSHLEGHFETPNLNEILKVQLHAHTYSTSNHPGEVSLQADLIEPVSKNLLSFKSRPSGSFNFKFNHFPTAIFQSFARPFSGELSALTSSIGPVFNLNCFLKLLDGKGPVRVDLQSENIKTLFNMELNEGYLSLQDDLVAQLRLNEHLSKTWLHKIHPLLVSAASSKLPLTLKIAKENFHLPIAPFEVSKLTLQSAKLDLGQLQLKPSLHMDQLYALFSEKSKPTDVKAWFTPCHFSIKKGVLHLETNHFQLDDRFHLALFGDWDFNQNKNLFFLGLPSSTLDSEFALSNLPKDFAFQVPLKDQEGLIKANWKLAQNQIALLSSPSSPFTRDRAEYLENNFKLDQIMEVVAQYQRAHQEDVDVAALPWNLSSAQIDPEKKPAPNHKDEILQNLLKVMRKKLIH